MKKVYTLILNFVFVMLGSAFSQAPWIEWQRYYGGISGDWANSVQQTTDGGYIIAGGTSSNDGDVSGNHGARDYWVLKTDSVGNPQWQKCLGGSSYDECISISQIRDGGYILIGKIQSNDGDITVFNGYEDYWIVKLDGAGTIQWQKTFGGSNFDTPTAIEQTSDNGFIASGYTSSNDSDVIGNHGGEDYWIIKIDSSGNLQWKKCYGGSGDDEAKDICQISDGSFVVVGSSLSNDGDVLNTDTIWGCSWIIKLDSIGNLISQRVFNRSPGGVPDSMKYVSTVTPTFDNGVVVVGHYNFQPGGASASYIYTEKFDSVLTTVWDKNYHWQQYQFQYTSCGDIQPTNDGGYVISAWYSANTLFAIIKVDSTGNFEWHYFFCCTYTGYAYTKQTSDGGYIFAKHWSGASADVWVIKFGYSTTSLTENSLAESSVAANLTSANNLSLTFSSLQSANLRLTVLDIIGRTLYQTQLTATTGINKKEIQVGDLAKGIYIVTLSGEEGSESVKVVKE